jgi:hypothetical protein
MKKTILSALVSMIVLGAAGTPAIANPFKWDSPDPGYKLNDFGNWGSPIAIVGGGAWHSDGWESHCVSFRNTSTKTAIAIEFVFRYWNAFYDFVSSEADQQVGTFSPGVDILYPSYGYTTVEKLQRNCWRNLATDSAVGIDAYVTRVRFEDGSEWLRKGGDVPTKMLH